MTEDDKHHEDEYLPGEQRLLGAIALELAAGRMDALAAFLARGKPVSAAAASFLGAALQEEKIGGYNPRRLEHIASLGRPKTDSSARINRTALWIHWMVHKPNVERRNPKREWAIVRGAKRFHVDEKLVRARLKFFEQWPPIHPREFRKVLMRTIGDVVSSLTTGSDSQTKSTPSHK
jgi:hypothetical protein